MIETNSPLSIFRSTPVSTSLRTEPLAKVTPTFSMER